MDALQCAGMSSGPGHVRAKERQDLRPALGPCRLGGSAAAPHFMPSRLVQQRAAVPSPSGKSGRGQAGRLAARFPCTHDRAVQQLCSPPSSVWIQGAPRPSGTTLLRKVSMSVRTSGSAAPVAARVRWVETRPTQLGPTSRAAECLGLCGVHRKLLSAAAGSPVALQRRDPTQRRNSIDHLCFASHTCVFVDGERRAGVLDCSTGVAASAGAQRAPKLCGQLSLHDAAQRAA